MLSFYAFFMVVFRVYLGRVSHCFLKGCNFLLTFKKTVLYGIYDKGYFCKKGNRSPHTKDVHERDDGSLDEMLLIQCSAILFSITWGKL